MPEKRTINVRDDIPPDLRDSLIRQLEGSPPMVVGNLADLNRLGANTVAAEGLTEVFQNPSLDDEEAKKGAQRVVDEVDAIANPPEPEPDTGEEPLNEKDPAVVKASRDREAELGGIGGSSSKASTRATNTPKAGNG